MIDTLRLRIPLTRTQFKRIREIGFASDREQLGFFSPKTGEIRLKRVEGLFKTDQNSFHREIRWELSPEYHLPLERSDGVTGRITRVDRTFLTVELSLPKFWYGHNICLLYNFRDAIAYLKQLLEKRFKLTRCRLASLDSWQVSRVDCCYAWKFPTQVMAQQVLESLKRLHYPRKKPHIHDTSITFAGATYTVKFYLKLPEFRNHDMKALIKEKASLEWVNHLEEKAAGVLRYEATLRPKYLGRAGIHTVNDLVRSVAFAEWDKESQYEGFNSDIATFAIVCYQMQVHSRALGGKFENGQRYDAPSGVKVVAEEGGQEYIHRGGGFTYVTKDKPTTILQYFLTKFLGDEPMRTVDQVLAKLEAVYKPVKAARLVGFWLYVQKFGTNSAKDKFGHDSYYRSKADLRRADVSLMEPPANVTPINRDFLQAFRFEVPSDHVTNRVDDFRDSDNLLNLAQAFGQEVRQSVSKPDEDKAG